MSGYTEEQKEASKKEYTSNMQKTYAYRNSGLDIKMKTMELLHEQVVLLAEKSKKCKSDDELYRIQEVMAMLGQAIIPD